jgi:hypothetical protein
VCDHSSKRDMRPKVIEHYHATRVHSFSRFAFLYIMTCVRVLKHVHIYTHRYIVQYHYRSRAHQHVRLQLRQHHCPAGRNRTAKGVQKPPHLKPMWYASACEYNSQYSSTFQPPSFTIKQMNACSRDLQSPRPLLAASAPSHSKVSSSCTLMGGSVKDLSL